MKSLSATCLAIAIAYKNGTLKLIEKTSRFGDTYIAIEDDRGIIEVAGDMNEANARVTSLMGK